VEGEFISKEKEEQKQLITKKRHRYVTDFISVVRPAASTLQKKKYYQWIERDEVYAVKTKNHFCPGVGGEGADTVCFFQLILECSRFLPGDITAHHLLSP